MWIKQISGKMLDEFYKKHNLPVFGDLYYSPKLCKATLMLYHKFQTRRKFQQCQSLHIKSNKNVQHEYMIPFCNLN